MTQIVAMIPFARDKNLGRACNECMALLPDGAWAIFQDHDAMPTTPHWYRQFAEAIECLPDAGAIVAMTNRIARKWQRCGDAESNDIAVHRRFGAERARLRTLLDISNTRGFGGVLYAVNKEAWAEAGGYVEGALGCTEHSLFFRMRANGRRIYMHEGLFCFHFRHQGQPDPTLLSKIPDCQCMKMPEVMPTVRVALP